LPLKNVLLIGAGVLLLAVILSYAAILRLEAGVLSSIQDFEENIFKIGNREDKVIENNVFGYEGKIKDFRSLWMSRVKTANFFGNFEGLVHPQVWFSSFSLNPSEMEASVSGKTINFETMEQQLLFLRSRNDLVEGFDLSELSLGDEGNVNFGLNINFTPKIFEAPEK